MSAEMSATKKLPGSFTRGRAKLLEKEFEDFATEDAAEDASENVAVDTTEENFGLEDDGVADFSDEYQAFEDNVEGNDGEGSSRE